MEHLPISTFFLLSSYEDSLLVSLRSILSLFLLNEKIVPFSKISLQSLYSPKKLIEFRQDVFKEYHYIEHPTSFRIVFSTFEKSWNGEQWYDWVSECIDKLYLYPKIQKRVRQFFKTEIESVIGISKYQLQYLCDNVEGFERDILEPYFMYQYRLSFDTMKQLRSVDWNTMLKGHCDAMRIVFQQVSSPLKRKNLVLNIFKLVEILSPMLEKVLTNSNKLSDLILDFKKEINKIIQNEVSFVETKKINFREWFLSLSQFLLYCEPIQFNIKRSIFRLQIILYLVFPNDQVLKTEKISYSIHSVCKKLPNSKKERLCNVHPFVRNIHLDYILNE